MKNTVAILLSLVLMLQALPVTAMAGWSGDETHRQVDVEDGQFGQYTYTYNGLAFSYALMETDIPGQAGYRYANITGVGETDVTELTFPARVVWHEGRDDEALLDVKRVDCALPGSVTKAVFPTGVEEIDCSFNTVTEVVLPDTLKEIGTYAFRGSAITAVTIPASVGRVGAYAFYECKALQSVTFQGTDTAIGEYAFADCAALTTLRLPTAITDLGEHAFAGCYVLTDTNLAFLTALREIPNSAFSGAFCEPTGTKLTLPDCVQTIGEKAFYSTKLSEVTMPASLRSIGPDAFAYGDITKLNWPATVDAAFTAIDGFCGNDFAELDIPDTVTTIADGAFSDCHALRSVTVAPQVTAIGDGAFDNCESIASLTVVDSTAPLTIGDYAFRGCTGLAGATVVLPRRVTRLGDNTFADIYSGGTGADFEIQNPSLTLTTYEDDGAWRARYHEAPVADPWCNSRGSTAVYYPANMTAETAPVFFRYMDWCAQDTWQGNFHPTFAVKQEAPTPVVKAKYTVSGTVQPRDATVEIVTGGGQHLYPTVTGGAFTAEVDAGGVTVAVSRDGYTTSTLTKSAREFTTDWNLSTVALTPVSDTGKLQLTTSGAGGSDAHVTVFDSIGATAASGTARAGLFLCDALPSGTYTVVAFADNPHFSTIAAESDLAAMGITDYASVAVTVRPVETTAAELAVPAMDTSSLTAYVEKADMLLQRRQIAKGVEFFVRVNYKMQAGHPVNAVTFTVPDGLTVTSVSSATRSYGADFTIHPVGADQTSGILYLGLRAAKPGSYSVGAAATSGTVTVPMGSAAFRVDELVMELRHTLIRSRNVEITLYGAPNKTLYIQAGTGDEKAVQTNELGIYTGTIQMPDDTIVAFPTRIMAATEPATSGGSTTAQESVRLVEDSARITESSFIHAGREYYTVSQTHTIDNYYTYVSNGEEKNKYWTYRATIESVTPVTGPVTLVVYMLDGSSRKETMSLLRRTATGGGYKQEYACSFYLEQVGDHIFSGALIPNSYSVLFTHHGQDIALDARLVTYINRVAEEDYTQRQQIIREVIEEYGLAPGDADSLFNGEYIISGDPDFPYLPPDVQQEILISEAAVRDAMDLLMELVGAEGPFDACDDPGDFLTDIVDADFPDPGDPTPPYDPSALADDGYTVSPADSGGDANGSSYAVKPHSDDSGFQYTSSGGVKLNTKPLTDAMDDAGWAMAGAVMNQLSNHANKLAEMAAGLKIDGTFGHVNTLRAKQSMGKLTKCVKVAGAGLCAGFNCIQVNRNANGYVDAVAAYEELKGKVENIDIHRRNYERHGANKYCMEAVEKELAAAQALLETLKDQKDSALRDTLVGAGFTVGGLLAALFSGGMGGVVVEALNTAYDVGSNCAALARASVMIKQMEDFAYAQQDRELNCAGKAGGVYKTDGILDPSGIVYEAVESNILGGVTATCYNVTDDPDNTEAWNAAAYDQTNPQVTNETGSYAWDVPAGRWQIRFTKAGYQDAATDVLTVPPPRTGLKTAMVSTASPHVIGANAYPNYVELVFDQYMNTADALTVPAGYSAQWVDPEPVSEGSAVEYARVLHLKPTAGTLSGKVSVTLGGAKNYAGTPLGNYGSGKLTVQVCPTAMELNYTDAVAVLVGEDPSPRVTVRVTDSTGIPIPDLTVQAAAENDLFAAVTAVSATTDAQGIAVFSVAGQLPGYTDLTFCVAGAGLQKTIPLHVTVESNQVERPTAKVGYQTLSAGAPKENYVLARKGGTLTLDCATPGASVYYSVNDTCPCQDLTGRTLYTGPIPILEDGYYRIVAYKDGMEYSERLNLHVTAAEVLLGDINGQEDPASGDAGVVSALDMQRLFEHLSGTKPITVEKALLAADVNCDSTLDILDYQALYLLWNHG